MTLRHYLGKIGFSCVLLALAACSPAPSQSPQTQAERAAVPTSLPETPTPTRPTLSPDEEDARALYIDAYELVQQSYEMEHSRPEDASDGYRSALSKIDRLLGMFPSTMIALDLTRGNSKLGPYTLNELRNTVVPQLRVKQIMKDPVSLVREMIEAEDSEFLRARTYSDLAVLALQYKQHSQADVYLGEAQAAAREIAIDDEFIGNAYEHILNLCIDVNDTRTALAIAENLDKQVSSVPSLLAQGYLYDIVGQAYMIGGQVDQGFAAAAKGDDALVRYEEGRGEADEPYKYRLLPSGRAQATFVRILARTGQISDARTHIAQFPTDDPAHPSVLAAVAEEYARIGEFDSAMKLTREIPDIELAAWTHYEIAQLHIERQQLEPGRQHVQEFQVALNNTGHEPRDWEREPLVRVLAAVGELEAAKQVAEQIGSAQFRAASLSHIGAAYAVASDSTAATKYFNRAIAEVNGDPLGTMEAYTRRDIVHDLARSRRYTDALRVANEIREDHVQVVALSQILANLTLHGDTLDQEAVPMLLELALVDE